jgi:hypothetical protein
MKLKISFSTESPAPKGRSSSDETDKKGRSTDERLGSRNLPALSAERVKNSEKSTRFF